MPYVWGFRFIWQVRLVTSHRLSELTKLRNAVNNVYVKCDIHLRGERIYFQHLLETW